MFGAEERLGERRVLVSRRLLFSSELMDFIRTSIKTNITKERCFIRIKGEQAKSVILKACCCF